jgi:hypothetical protein
VVTIAGRLGGALDARRVTVTAACGAGPRAAGRVTAGDVGAAGIVMDARGLTIASGAGAGRGADAGRVTAAWEGGVVGLAHAVFMDRCATRMTSASSRGMASMLLRPARAVGLESVRANQPRSIRTRAGNRGSANGDRGATCAAVDAMLRCLTAARPGEDDALPVFALP